MNIAIIPARGGSIRIPGKNIRYFHGKPIIAYSIATARASGLFSQIVVSTEDEYIAAVARVCGAKVHPRPRHLADHTTGTQEVMKVALEWWLQCGPGMQPEFACCIYATAPMMSAADLLAGREKLKGDINLSYAYTVGPDRRDAGQFYWGRPEHFRAGVALDGNSAHLVVEERRVCDINTESDWLRAEELYLAMLATEAVKA